MLEALVAGAGPAGAATALLLARAGKSVRVIDRAVFPRTKPCGEYLSAGSVGLLRDLGVADAVETCARRVRGVRLHGHGVSAVIDFPNPGWSLPRAVLDAALLDAARSAGAEVSRGRIEDCSDGDDCASVVVRNPDGSLERVYAPAVIGADGIHSIVARKCGFAGSARAGSRFALGGHYGGFRALDEYIDMFVDGHTYVAINPLTDGTANVMLVVDEPEVASHRDALDAFAEERARRLAGDLLLGASLDGKRLAIGPLSYRAQRFCGSHVLLAGDAACFVDPFTGQGVSLALRCARLAAESVLSGRIESYEARARREIATRRRSAAFVAQLIRTPLVARAAAALMRGTPAVFQPLIHRVTDAA